MATIIRDSLVELLVGVNQCLAKTRQHGEIALYLDAALLLAIGGKMEIPHVDGIAGPRRVMEDILHHVGKSHKYKGSWFNDDVASRLSKNNEIYHY
jgi:hypothetical protein